MTTVEERVHPRPGLGWTGLGLIVGAGAALGAVSLALDELTGPVGRMVRGLGGGAFAWGTVALLAGYLGRRRRSGPARAVLVLATATLAYYGLIVAIGHRWRGATLADGRSAVWVSLASVGRATVLWLAGSVLAGILLGWLGERIRDAAGHRGAVAAGVAAGVLSGQAATLVLQMVGSPVLTWNRLATQLLTLLLAVAIPAGLLRRANPDPPMWTYVAAVAATVGVAALGWTGVESLR